MKQSNHTRLDYGDSVSHSPGQKLYVGSRGVHLGNFTLMYEEGALKVAKKAKDALPTLMVLIASVKFENLARCRANLIAHTLGVSVATVYRQLKELQKEGFIIPDEAEGEKPRAVFNWRIDPRIAWHGNTKDLDAYLKALPPDHEWNNYGDG